MQLADQSLKAAFLSASRCQNEPNDQSKESEDDVVKTSNHLLYLGKTDLPHRPVRMRYFPFTNQRFLLYGIFGYQEMITSHAPEFYALQPRYRYVNMIKISDCAQTKDGHLLTLSRTHDSAELTHYDALMMPIISVEIPYPKGCISSIAINRSCTFLYGTNLEMNCLLRFSLDNLSLSKSQGFGVLWRPFDCCTSQEFLTPDGSRVQFLFVSNLDSGICAFNMETMEMVAECGDDLIPGAKYLAYDAKRCLLFVSCSCELLLRCYKFQVPASLAPVPVLHSATASLGVATSTATTDEIFGDSADLAVPSLVKIGDFLIANRKPNVRSSSSQCLMWDSEMDQLAVISWSHVKGKFSNKVFRVNI